MNIAGVKNYEGHGSSAQKSIWHSIKMLAHFEPIFINCNDFDNVDIVEGEKNFYDFIKNLYNDMYDNPAKYVIPTSDYDEYMSKKEEADSTKHHKTDIKESKLRNSFQQAIEFYPNYFYEIGLAADKICKDTFSLIIPKSKYDKALISLNRPHIRQNNEQRLKILVDLGITVDEVDEMCYIYNKNSPKMFLGLYVLCSAPDNKYKRMNYLRLNYKGYLNSVTDLEDIKQTMAKEHANAVDLIIKSVISDKMKYKVKPLRSITSSHGWKVRYTQKGKNVFGFFSEPDYLALYIYFNEVKNITEMSKKLENDIEMFDWYCDKFPEILCKCPHNKAVIFGDMKRRICGMSNKAEIINPTVDDIKKSIMIIKMFRNL